MIKYSRNLDGTIGNIQIVKADENKKDNCYNVYDIALAIGAPNTKINMNKINRIRSAIIKAKPVYIGDNNLYYYDEKTKGKIVEEYCRRYKPWLEHSDCTDKKVISAGENEMKKYFIDKIYVKLTQEEYKNLTNKYNKELVDKKIEEMDCYLAEKGKSYKDYPLILTKWIVDDVKKQKEEFETTKTFEPNIQKIDINGKACLVFKFNGLTHIATEWQQLGV